VPDVNPWYGIGPYQMDWSRYQNEPGFEFVNGVFDSEEDAVAYADKHGMPFPPGTHRTYDAIRARM